MKTIKSEGRLLKSKDLIIKCHSEFRTLVLGFYLLLFAFPAFSQSIFLQGIVLDSLEAPLVGASVILKHKSDDKLEAFAITDGTGRFAIESNSVGEFSLQITYLGYGTFERNLTLKEGDEGIHFGEIVLRQNAYDLEGVTVKDSFIPIVIKKDTIEYNAAAFKTAPNATVEDLLKKLPGIDVEKDGTIRAQGEEVESVLVDGKEFFDEDPKIASRNIPAEVVDKVQVFDRQSEFTEFTGINDGNESKAINLEIKEGKNKGLFGNVKANYGTEDRYLTSTNLNRFNEKMQLSLVGNLNNINEQVFSLMDYLKFTGGLEDAMSGQGLDPSQIPLNLIDNAGNNDLYSGGLNFNYDFNSKTELRSNYFYNLSDNLTEVSSTLENIIGEGSFRTRALGSESRQLENHRFKLKLKHMFDKTQDLTAKFRGGFTENSGKQDQTSEALLNNQSLVNRSRLNTESILNQANWESELIFRKKFKKEGRFFTADFSFSSGNSETDGLVQNETEFHDKGSLNSIDSTDQQQQQAGQSLDYAATLNYVEPLGKANYLSFSLSRESAKDDNEKIFLDRVNSNQLLVNEDLSSDYQRNYSQNTVGLAFKKVREKFEISLGLDYQVLDLENIDRKGLASFNKQFNNFLPNARFSYQFNKASRFATRYSTMVRPPALEQLQPVIDNSIPTRIYQGNPDLSAEYVHRLNINYNFFDQFYFRSLFMGFNSQYIENSISDAIIIDKNLVTITRPVNSKDEWRLGFFYEYNSPIQNKNLKFDLGGQWRLQQSNVLTNGSQELAQITTFTQFLNIENKKKEKIDWLLGGSISPNFTRYKNHKDQNQSFFDYSLDADFACFFGDSWTWEINYTYESYSDASFGQATNFNFLHSTLTKSIADRKFVFSLKGVNLLDENILVQRNSIGNQFSEQLKNRLGRYFMAGVTWNLRSFGK